MLSSNHALRLSGHELVPLGVLFLGLALVYGLYVPGLSGGLYYDDVDRLTPLAGLESLESYIYYIFAGETGPFGRPLAMASFLLHISDWPDETVNIFRVNVLIHLLNGLLLVWLCILLIELRSPDLTKHRRLWIAIATGLLWSGLPLLASTSLIAIQRMTSLSAMFSLIGLILYLKGLKPPQDETRSGLAIQVAGLALCTALAALTKENGLLLPVYVLVLELTLLRQADPHGPLRRLRLGLLASYALLILGYLVLYAFDPSPFIVRDFTLIERLQTQPLILWHYLGQAFLPRTLWLSPFHDSYPKVASLLSSPAALTALVAWVTLLIAAIHARKRWPFFSFAVLWFLAGHLLESSVLPLELYFEHRNYMPIIGPCLALAWYGLNAQGSLKRAMPAVLGIYVVLTWGLLYQTTTLWGDQRLAAEIWHNVFPTSPRASLNLAAYHANQLGDGMAALRTFDATSSACPHCLDTRLMAIPLACLLETQDQLAVRVKDIHSRLNQAKAGPAPVVLLGRIAHLQHDGQCQAFSLEALEKINHQLLSRPAFRNWSGPHRGIRFNLYEIALMKGDRRSAVDELQAAWRAAPGLDIAALLVGELIQDKKYEEALTFLAKVKTHAPANPIVNWLWLRECEEQTNKVLSARKSDIRS